MLKPSRRGGSNEHPCLGSRIRKIVYPCVHQFYYVKVGSKRVFDTLTCLHDDLRSFQNHLLVKLFFQAFARIHVVVHIICQEQSLMYVYDILRNHQLVIG